MNSRKRECKSSISFSIKTNTKGGWPINTWKKTGSRRCSRWTGTYPMYWSSSATEKTIRFSRKISNLKNHPLLLQEEAEPRVWRKTQRKIWKAVWEKSEQHSRKIHIQLGEGWALNPLSKESERSTEEGNRRLFAGDQPMNWYINILKLYDRFCIWQEGAWEDKNAS